MRHPKHHFFHTLILKFKKGEGEYHKKSREERKLLIIHISATKKYNIIIKGFHLIRVISFRYFFTSYLAIKSRLLLGILKKKIGLIFGFLTN